MKKSLLAVALFLGICTVAEGQAVVSVTNNVRVAVASEQQAEGPNKWYGIVQWAYEDQGFHGEACTAFVLPYGTAIPNGPLEFPGDWLASGTIASWCAIAAPGECVKVTVEQLSKPSKFGNYYRVASITGTCF